MNDSLGSDVFSLPSALVSAYQAASQKNRPFQSNSKILDGWSLAARDPNVIAKMMPLMKWFYDHYYQVSTDGWQHIPDNEPVMFVGSHNGGLAAPDMHMMLFDFCDRFGPKKPLYGLMHPKVSTVAPALARMAAQMGAVRAHPKMALAALKQNASIVVYPGGASDVFRPYAQRDRIYFHNRKGFIKLAIKTGTPIVPIISTGAHSTFVVLADIYPQMKALHELGMPWFLDVDPETFPIYLGLPWGLAFGPLPHLPIPTKVHTRVCPVIRFERTGSTASKDSQYVEACFQRVKSQMQQSLDRLVAQTR